MVGGACEICFLSFFFSIRNYSANKDNSLFTPPGIKLLRFMVIVLEGTWELCLHRLCHCSFLSLSRWVQNLRPVKFCKYHTSFLSPWPLCLWSLSRAELLVTSCLWQAWKLFFVFCFFSFLRIWSCLSTLLKVLFRKSFQAWRFLQSETALAEISFCF